MRHGIGFLAHVDFVAPVQRHAEFLLDRVHGICEQANAKLAVLRCFREEAFSRVDGPLHEFRRLAA